MEYKRQLDIESTRIKPRIIIHGGAGNIPTQDKYPRDKYAVYRQALISIVTKTREYMLSLPEKQIADKGYRHPSALEVATYAVSQLEDCPLFNASHGAVFTRDGINQLEASVMVSEGHDKRGVGVMGLRRVKHPIQLAKRMLEAGDQDLAPPPTTSWSTEVSYDPEPGKHRLDVPSAQGHTQIYGQAAEQLAEAYGLELVDPSYFFTQQRWDEHVRALEREKSGIGALGSATWSADEYLPQGTVGAVALDERGVVCVATSTGGMTNKLTGRVGDTPVPGAGFWAEQWQEDGDPTGEASRSEGALDKSRRMWAQSTIEHGGLELAGSLKGFLADCFPTPFLYHPTSPGRGRGHTTTRSMAGSGTGNGDSFLRIAALRTLAARARFKPEAGKVAVSQIAGAGGELQRSAGDRWGRTGEGEGGIIGIESVVVRDSEGTVVDVRSDLLMDYNCGGMYRAWVDDRGVVRMSIWTNGAEDKFWLD